MFVTTYLFALSRSATQIKSFQGATPLYLTTSRPRSGHSFGRTSVGSRQGEDTAGHVVTLKLKRANHSSLTRRVTLNEPTHMDDTIYRTAQALFDQVGDQGL